MRKLVHGPVFCFVLCVAYPFSFFITLLGRSSYAINDWRVNAFNLSFEDFGCFILYEFS